MSALMRALGLSLWLCAFVASAQPDPASVCDAAEFDAEVIHGPAGRALCPRPQELELERLWIKLERASNKDTQAFFEVLRALRTHLAKSDASWRLGLAGQIDDALAQVTGSRLPPLRFALVRNAVPDLDPEACLFVTGDAGLPGYACYVLRGTGSPVHPQRAQMAVHELSDFRDAYLAHRALAVAHKASLKLDLPALEQALERLARANQRWSNLRGRGYLQYPWELAWSSVFSAYNAYQACFAADAYCTGEEGLDPQRFRLIALHPGVGMGFSGFGWKQKPSADAALALSLEVFGATYYASDFRSYVGASVGAVVNDGDFADLRPGVFLHLTRWVHLGYLVSVFRSATRYDATVFLSTDLGSALGLDFFD